MKAKILLASLICIALSSLMAYGYDNTALDKVWPIIYDDTASLKSAGDHQLRLEKARKIVDDFAAKDLDTVPTNQLAFQIGRLSAGIFLLGEEGNVTDEKRLIKFVQLRLPNPRIIYLGNLPMLSGLISPSGDSEQERFPACYALAKILKNQSAKDSQPILDSATDNNLSQIGVLRILGVIIQSRSDGVDEFATKIRNRFPSESVAQSVKDFKNGVKWYWSGTI